MTVEKEVSIWWAHDLSSLLVVARSCILSQAIILLIQLKELLKRWILGGYPGAFLVNKRALRRAANEPVAIGFCPIYE